MLNLLVFMYILR